MLSMLHFIYGLSEECFLFLLRFVYVTITRHQEHFGTINGFRLGRLPSIDVGIFSYEDFHFLSRSVNKIGQMA